MEYNELIWVINHLNELQEQIDDIKKRIKELEKNADSH